MLTLRAHVTGDFPVVTEYAVHELPGPQHGGITALYARLPRVELTLVHEVLTVLAPVTHNSTPPSAGRSGSSAPAASPALRCASASGRPERATPLPAR